jgi:hypothetical protein
VTPKDIVSKKCRVLVLNTVVNTLKYQGLKGYTSKPLSLDSAKKFVVLAGIKNITNAYRNLMEEFVEKWPHRKRGRWKRR